MVVLVIILLLFGTKRLRNLGADLGHAVKGFRKGMQTDTDPSKLGATTDTTTDDATEADAGTTTKSSVSSDK